MMMVPHLLKRIRSQTKIVHVVVVVVVVAGTRASGPMPMPFVKKKHSTKEELAVEATEKPSQFHALLHFPTLLRQLAMEERELVEWRRKSV